MNLSSFIFFPIQTIGLEPTLKFELVPRVIQAFGPKWN